MNGKTAKLVNKLAFKLGTSKHKLADEWNALSHRQRGKRRIVWKNLLRK